MCKDLENCINNPLEYVRKIDIEKWKTLWSLVLELSDQISDLIFWASLGVSLLLVVCSLKMNDDKDWKE